MKIPSRLDPLTIAARADGYIDGQSGGVVPSFQPSTTYARDQNNRLLHERNCYGRDDNDVTRLAENIISKLEGASESLLFPSGMAAIAALMRTLPNGGTIVLQSGIYWGTTKWLREFCIRRNISLIEMDCSNANELDSLIISAKPDIVFVETPSNPWLKIVDIERAASACRKSGALLAVDSTAATPILSQPLSLGADIVMHSATKAINGHSDVLAGVLCTGDGTTPKWAEIKLTDTMRVP